MPPAYGELWKSIFDGIFFVSSFLLITRGGGGGGANKVMSSWILVPLFTP